MNKQKVKKIIFIVFSLSILLFTACGGGGGGGAGTLKVSLTDAPANFDGVFVTISNVLVHQSADSGEEEIESAQESGWREVAINSSITMPINLLELQDATVLLAEGSLPARPGGKHRFRTLQLCGSRRIGSGTGRTGADSP
jgi:hypothetical protein